MLKDARQSLGFMSELWVERHRPQSVDEIRGQASVVSRLTVYAEHKEFPHLLFAGPPGTGKTTAAMALTTIRPHAAIWGCQIQDHLSR